MCGFISGAMSLVGPEQEGRSVVAESRRVLYSRVLGLSAYSRCATTNRDCKVVNRGSHTPLTKSVMRRLRNDAGFSLIEVIVALAIMVMLAASITPTVVNYLDQQRVEKSIELVGQLLAAAQEFENDVNDWPQQLVFLTRDVTSTEDNICGGNLDDDANWSGPYLLRSIPATGLPIFIGRANNTILRTPATGGAAPIIQIVVPNVRYEDALAIDDILDGDGVSTTGQARWTTEVASSGNVAFFYYTYVLPANEC